MEGKGSLEESRQRFIAIGLYRIGDHIAYLYMCRTGDRVVYDDGSIEKDGRSHILGTMINLSKLLERHNFGRSGLPELNKLIEHFKKVYKGGSSCWLNESDRSKLREVIQRLKGALEAELAFDVERIDDQKPLNHSNAIKPSRGTGIA